MRLGPGPKVTVVGKYAERVGHTGPVRRTAYLLLVLGAWLAAGPWPVLALLVLLVVPRVRRAVGPTWRSAGIVLALVVLTTGVVVVLPDGWLPIPPGPGLLVTPSYVGAPATAQPVTVEVPRNPAMAPNGTSSMHDDAWASDTYTWGGPLGVDPQVDTAWFGIEECATLAFTSSGTLVALCGDVQGPTLHLLDPDTMHKLDSLELPDRPGGRGKRPWQDLCAGAYFYLDDQERAVVATTDRRVLVVSTSDADGDPRLTEVRSYDVAAQVPEDDCLVALMPDWAGRIWFGTEQGRMGVIDRSTGDAESIDLDGGLANSFAVDEDGVYVVTDEALYRLAVAASGTVSVDWRTPYDRGSGQKPGQLSQGSGTTPTVLPGGLVAITDNAEPRMDVVVLRTSDGSEVCRVPVFEDGESATENSLVSVGDGVIVENNYGYAGPLSTTLGRTTSPGLARVDVSADGCSVAWTSDEVAPTSVPKVSLANGLLYAYTTTASAWLVNAWYLTSIDVRTGETAFSVRTGTGLLSNNHYAAVTLSPEGAAYIATLSGMVRVRDGS